MPPQRPKPGIELRGVLTCRIAIPFSSLSARCGITGTGRTSSLEASNSVTDAGQPGVVGAGRPDGHLGTCKECHRQPKPELPGPDCGKVLRHEQKLVAPRNQDVSRQRASVIALRATGICPSETSTASTASPVMTTARPKPTAPARRSPAPWKGAPGCVRQGVQWDALQDGASSRPAPMPCHWVSTWQARTPGNLRFELIFLFGLV